MPKKNAEAEQPKQTQTELSPIQGPQPKPVEQQYMTLDDIYAMYEYQAMVTNPADYWWRQRG
jgi:hypothetical protein